MLKIAEKGKRTIRLPMVLNIQSAGSVIDQCITNGGDARASWFQLDFSDLADIDPVGVVVLSNLIEYLRRCNVSGNMHAPWRSPGVQYLDDTGFFARYNEKPLRTTAKVRSGMLPLTLVESMESTNYVFTQMVPWLSREMGVSELALGTLRVCLEEIFFNIADHSGTGVGCVAAQIFSGKDLHIAISDFGQGIPRLVRTVAPHLSDREAVRLACEEGFTTKSNVRNRGAGIPNLMKIITSPKWGVVWLDSGFGNVSAAYGGDGPKIVPRARASFYPGTLVRIVINLKSVLASLPPENEREDLEW